MLKCEFDSIIGDGYYNKNYKEAGYIAGTKEENGYVYSYINNDGKVLLKKEFNDINRITEIPGNEKTYLIASKNGKKGLYINEKEVIPCQYQDLSYNEGAKLIIAKRNDQYGVFDLEGKNIIPVQNDSIVMKGIHIVATNDSISKEYDAQGKEIKDSKYKLILSTPNEEFFITVDQENNYGLINSRGIEVIENKYDYLEYLTDNYFSVYSNENKIGVVDSNGHIILGMKYDVMQKIKGSNIVQAIQIDSKIIELYKNDMEKIATKEDYSIYIYDNYIKLIGKDDVSYFDLDGKEKTSKDIFTDNKLFATNIDGLWGFENKNGDLIVNAVYDSVTEFNEYGFAGVRKKDKWGIINEKGETIIEPIYTIEQKNIEPNFIGKYYKINFNGETYYTSEVK